MAAIRLHRDIDLDETRRICVRTANSGQDSTPMTAFPDLVPDIFLVPYTVHDPDLCFVVEDGGRAVGYIVGCADTVRFATWFRDEWAPLAGRKYPQPIESPQSWDELWTYCLHFNSYPRMVVPGIEDYPSHLHIDLAPEFHRLGLGRELMLTYLKALRTAGVPGVHVCVSAQNPGGLKYYDSMGFRPIEVPDPAPVVWLGRSTDISDLIETTMVSRAN
ncbi:GNAT family N-acetyltransferase [Luedemannella helvata]|uniref:N-acetyltransferase n=1 Tax=Luedemannella helvata TaxID=349315 RepID=A0ABN2KDM7_9ACTN